MEGKNINTALLSICEIYGLSGNCGEKCPKYQDKSCECMDFDGREEWCCKMLAKKKGLRDLSEGMYIRTKDGVIAKVEYIDGKIVYFNNDL